MNVETIDKSVVLIGRDNELAVVDEVVVVTDGFD